jgi:lipid A disaccharide synthetase
MMTSTQKADRLALIATIAEKQNAKKRSNAAFKAKLTAKSKTVSASPARKVRKSEVKYLTEAFFKSIDKMDENHNQWTDASKYADQYYGETMRETTKYDNDWG